MSRQPATESNSAAKKKGTTKIFTRIVTRKKHFSNDLRSRMGTDGANLHASTELLNNLEGPDYTVGLSQVLDSNESDKE